MKYPSRAHSFSRRSRSQSLRASRGISLIEVLVAVVVLGIGLLGVAAMQSVALRGGQSSLETSQAIMQTNAILDAMRSNRANAVNYNTGGMVCAQGAAGTLAQNDLRNWIGDLKLNITNNAADATTCGQIQGCPQACVITVQWDDSRAGGGQTRTIVTRTTI
ncbi:MULTISPECIES: type IV pilus modification PilV family protein [unclassified Pseudoxanthomonas]|uniref:type IV pilus modification PilV family protein n=1 Tax=unclassified Pseudoxanthomonas TaxID=2645906 RepID=UPI00261844EB|nr:prepilin-type N-terminal cleavage/methylation domain-containing protein [uncultured Pseudoxanthomonas sp.]